MDVHVSAPQVQQVTTVNPSKKKGTSFVITAIIVVSLALIVSVVYNMKKQNNSAPPTNESGSRSGWVVALQKEIFKDGESMPSDIKTVGYVLVDNTGKYIKTLSNSDVTMLDPLTIQKLSDHSAGTGSETTYNIVGDYIIEKTATWGPPAKPDVLKVALIEATSNFTILDTANKPVSYIGSPEHGTHIWSETSTDPKCDGMCITYNQLVIQKSSGSPVKVGTKVPFSSIYEFYSVPGKYVFFTTNSEGIFNAFSINLSTMKLADITKTIQTKSALNTPDSQLQPLNKVAFNQSEEKVYFISDEGKTGTTISSYNLSTQTVEVLAKFGDENNTTESLSYLQLSRSGKYLYYIKNDSSADTALFTPIDVTTKKVYASVRVTGPEVYYGPETGLIPGVDMTDETKPVTIGFEVTNIPLPTNTYDRTEIMGYTTTTN